MSADPIPTTSRLRSLDAARGFAIVGMVAANTSRAVKQAFPSGDPHQTLLHARWVGVHFADIVFPLFLFFVGIAIALSMENRRDQPIPWRRLLVRTLLLIVLGQGVNSISLLGSPAGTPLAINGTLQRIGVVYFVAVPIFLRTTDAVRIGLCATVLLAYGAALEWLPFPGVGPADLLERNLNIAAWVDLTILGESRMVPDANGIPTWSAGGLLSLPSTAVIALVGTLAGGWILRQREDPQRLALGMIGIGVTTLVAGSVWGTVHPMVKQIWTGSFVLHTSGVGLIVMAFFYAAIERKDSQGRLVHALEIMGRNSITAYLVHVLAVIVATVGLRGAYAVLTDVLSPQVATLGIILALLAMVFAPTWWMNRRGFAVRV